MKRSQGSYSTALVVFSLIAAAFLAPCRVWAAPAIINPSGQSLPSLFDGLKPSAIAITQLNLPPRTIKPWMGITARLPGLRNASIFLGASCPGAEVCSGGFATVFGVPGGCDPGDGEICDVNNFTIDPSGAECDQGVQNVYCGVNCCVSAIACINLRNCVR